MSTTPSQGSVRLDPVQEPSADLIILVTVIRMEVARQGLQVSPRLVKVHARNSTGVHNWEDVVDDEQGNDYSSIDQRYPNGYRQGRESDGIPEDLHLALSIGPLDSRFASNESI